MKKRENVWYVYMVTCSDGSLYTGITTDLSRRIAEHNSDKHGARYTRSRQPVKLAYFEECETRSLAGKREYSLKKLAASEKKVLVSNFSA